MRFIVGIHSAQRFACTPQIYFFCSGDNRSLRPVPADQIQKTIEAIELEIFNREEKEIPSSEIGEIVMDKLKDLDPVAYVRFASVYREFKDANTFMDELKKFLK